MKQKKRILVAPLNWGLGHATRCIPIINALLTCDFEPVIASDGEALELLKKEFPSLLYLELPSYNIKYTKNGRLLKLALISHFPKLLRIIHNEKKYIEDFVSKYNINGIISDNRFGVNSKIIPSVYLTHQLNVLSGSTTWLSSKLHRRIINTFVQCWIPDYENEPNLSGKLGHSKNDTIRSLKYLGSLSRFELSKNSINYDLLVLLSGPEPQRSILEKLLLSELKQFPSTTIFIRGVIEQEQSICKKGNLTIVNFMQSHELEQTIQESEIILTRSGYSTIMDMAKLGKRAFFIPTPGQFEQEYLAKRFSDKGITPFCKQDNFSIKELDRLKNYSGFKNYKPQTLAKELFSLFEGK